jgi:hypothetical protein
MFNYNRINEVKKSYHDLFYNDTLSAAGKMLGDQYGLSQKDFEDVSDIVTDIIVGKKSLKQLDSYISKFIKIKKEKAKNLASDICVYFLSAIDDEFELGAKEYLKQTEGDVEKYEMIKDLYQQSFDLDEEEMAVFEAEPQENTEEDKEEYKEAYIEEYIKTFEQALQVDDKDKERDEFKAIFRNYLTTILFTDDNDLKLILNYRLLYILSDATIAYLNKLKNIVSSNEEPVTSFDIFVENKKVKPVVKNWIKDFLLKLGTEVSALKKAQYLGSDPNVTRLPYEQKDNVRNLLEFYRMFYGFPDSLRKLPPERWFIIPVAVQEEAKTAKFKEKMETLGKEEEKETEEKTVSSLKIVEKSKELSKEEKQEGMDILEEKTGIVKEEWTADKIKEKYKGDEQEIKKIEQRTEKLRNITGLGKRQLIDIIIKELESTTPDIITIVSALRLLAEIKGFEYLLTDSYFKPFIINFIKENYGESAVMEFNDNPYQNKYLVYLLKNILQFRVGLSEDEAARYGLQLQNVNKRVESKYVNLARFNKKKGEFEWIENY